MKKLMLFGLLGFLLFLLVSCAGSATPRNPMEGERQEMWWRANTVGVADADNPWEKFVLPHVVDDNLDPWATYEQPKTFPEGWKPVKDTLMEDTRYHLKLKSIIRSYRKRNTKLRQRLYPKVEKSGLSPLEKMKKREREYFKKLRQQRRTI